MDFQPTSENMTLAMMIINQMLNRILILETRLEAYEDAVSDDVATLPYTQEHVVADLAAGAATDMMMTQAGVDNEAQVPDVEGASSEGSAAHDDAPSGCDR